MKYATAEAFRAALDQRLRNEATTTGVPVMRLRKRVAFERFLARLTLAAPERWVLKGAFALDLRLGLRTRTTKDIDLAGAHDETTATTDLLAAQAIRLPDHFNFEVARTTALDRTDEFNAVRFRVTSEVAGRRFEQTICTSLRGAVQRRQSVSDLAVFNTAGRASGLVALRRYAPR